MTEREDEELPRGGPCRERAGDKEPEGFVINEAQLLLAEKRTALAALRTGIAVSAIPISVLSFLVATSRYYDIMHTLVLLIPLMLATLLLMGLGLFLIFRSIANLRRCDRLLKCLRKRHSVIADLI